MKQVKLKMPAAQAAAICAALASAGTAFGAVDWDGRASAGSAENIAAWVQAASQGLPAARPLPGRESMPKVPVNIFDMRRLVHGPTGSPWAAVGRVRIGSTNWCTGTLISKRVVLTARHCVTGEKMSFVPDDRGPSYSDEAAARLAVVGRKNIKAGAKDDWALLILDKPLGEKYGWLKLSRKSPEELLQMNGRMASVGYPNAVRDGEVKILDPRCSLRGMLNGLYLDDCAVSPGSSGGPILLQDPAGGYEVVSVILAQCHPKGCEPVYGQATYMKEYANLSLIIYDYYDRILKIVGENE